MWHTAYGRQDGPCSKGVNCRLHLGVASMIHRCSRYDTPLLHPAFSGKTPNPHFMFCSWHFEYLCKTLFFERGAPLKIFNKNDTDMKKERSLDWTTSPFWMHKFNFVFCYRKRCSSLCYWASFFSTKSFNKATVPSIPSRPLLINKSCPSMRPHFISL